MKKSKVYTKSGDKGQTSLVSGARVSKADQRIDLYGDIDELNSYLGLCVSELDKISLDEHKDFFLSLQSALFDLGSNLACELENRQKYKLPQIEESFVSSMEKLIDEVDSKLEPIKVFILPGGHAASSHFHVARTICRRCERKLIGFNEQAPQNSEVFLNRLSDFLFVYARYVNFKMDQKEIFWVTNK